MNLKARKAAHRAFRDKLRENKRLRKERREARGWKPVAPPSADSRPPGLPPKPIPGTERIARPAPIEVKVALEDATAVLIAAEECMVLARRRKRGKDETVRLYVKHMKARGYSDEEAGLALAVGKAARRA